MLPQEKSINHAEPPLTSDYGRRQPQFLPVQQASGHDRPSGSLIQSIGKGPLRGPLTRFVPSWDHRVGDRPLLVCGSISLVYFDWPSPIQIEAWAARSRKSRTEYDSPVATTSSGFFCCNISHIPHNHQRSPSPAWRRGCPRASELSFIRVNAGDLSR